MEWMEWMDGVEEKILGGEMRQMVLLRQGSEEMDI